MVWEQSTSFLEFLQFEPTHGLNQACATAGRRLCLITHKVRSCIGMCGTRSARFRQVFSLDMSTTQGLPNQQPDDGLACNLLDKSFQDHFQNSVSICHCFSIRGVVERNVAICVPNRTCEFGWISDLCEPMTMKRFRSEARGAKKG